MLRALDLRCLLLTGSFLLIFSGVSSAKIVHYFDEQGKIHYVNTDYGAVPPKYLNQVKAQLDPPPQAPAANSPETTPAQGAPAKGAAQPGSAETSSRPASGQSSGGISIVVLSDGPLAPADPLKLILGSSKVSNTVYDINKEPGKTIYKGIGGGALPIVQVIKNKIMRSATAKDVLLAVEAMKNCSAE